MLTILITIVHVIVALILILVVLLQTGKRADLAGAFGGGGSQTAFGTRGAATLLTKATTTAAVLFMLTSLGLSLLASRESRSVLEETDIAPAAVEGPAAVDDQDFGEAFPLPVEATPEEGAVEEDAAETDQLDEGSSGTE